MDDLPLSGTIRLSEDPETPGYDLQAGQTWIYPTNYAVRDYQYNILQKALYKNTLVSLPTGLGKTFIAAVLMYNYYRWYPQGKIVFLAPTRPLVKQQIEACYDIMAIPKEVTAELTGTKLQTCRSEIWKDKRVFFATPQVLQNDLQTLPDLGPKIRCLVFDEAHKAKGNHAYCEVIRKLSSQNQLFRVLALSATPGNTVKDVLEVIKNLLISHLEFRTEESLDVRPYVFTRNLETVVVPLGDKLQKIKEEYILTLEKYTRTLVKYKIVQGNISNLTKGKIFMIMKEYQERNKGSANYNEIMKSLNICITLYHAYELLIRHGLRAFLKFFEEHISKPLLRCNDAIIRIMEEIKEYLGPEPTIETLPDGTLVNSETDTKFGHPKFHKLREILTGHFANEAGKTSKVIVFFEYRESVKEAFALLLQGRPTIRPRLFLGQGAGNTQKEQINVVKAFRQGDCNTLLSTCIGEEGLDVGEVDLIVCFDVSNKSPIRMIQRMGRTGRKRQGQIIILVTEGKEQEILKQCLLEKNHMGVFVLSSHQLVNGFYENSPKLVPDYVKPKCEKMFITVKKVPKKNGNLKEFLKKTSSSALNSPVLPEELDGLDLQERLPKFQQFWNKRNPLEQEGKLDCFNGRILEKQRSFQETSRVKHSKTTEMLVGLLQFADSKRFNIPMTQNRNLKQGDIRNMFAKSEQEFRLPETQVLSDKYNDQFPAELFTEISNFLSIQLSTDCDVCLHLLKSPFNYEIQSDFVDLSRWIQPDLALFDRITEKDLLDFNRSLNPEFNWSNDDFDKQLEGIDDDIFDLESKKFESKNESLFEMPSNFSLLMKSFQETTEDKITSTPIKETDNISKYFQISKTVSDLDKTTEILHEFTKFFKDSPMKNTLDKSKIEKNNNLELSENLFDTVNSEPEILENSPTNKQIIRPESPDLFSDDESVILQYLQRDKAKTPEKSQVIAEDSSSPILSNCNRASQFREKAQKKLFSDLAKKPNLANLKNIDCNESKLNISNIYDLPANDEIEDKVESRSFLNISDLCDLSNLMEEAEKKWKCNKQINEKCKNIVQVSETEETNQKTNQVEDFDISDFCDLSKFTGFFQSNQKVTDTMNLVTENNEIANDCPLKNTKVAKDVDDLDISHLCDLSDFIEPWKNSQKASKNGESPKTKEKIGNAKHIAETLNVKYLNVSDFSDLLDSTIVRNDGKIKKSNRKSPNIFRNQTTESEKEDLVMSDFCELPDLVKTPKNIETVSGKLAKLVDFCNLASFGLGNCKKRKTEEEKSLEANKSIQVNDVCDLSIFGLHHKITQKLLINPPKSGKNPIIDLTQSPEKTKSPSQFSITQILNFVDNNAQKENCEKTMRKPLSLAKRNILSTLNKTRNIPTIQNSSPTPKSPKNQPVTPLRKTKKNFPISNSDDDFEESPIKSIKPKPWKRVRKSPQKQAKRKSRQNKVNEFIDDEAVDRDAHSGDEASEEDSFDISFVTDETEEICTQMQVQYLKSVKSPVGRGKFKIPDRPRHDYSNIFSQPVGETDDTYANDSFCVESEDASEVNELSQLEILEMQLENKKNKRRRSGGGFCAKRRRVIDSSDDSD